MHFFGNFFLLFDLRQLDKQQSHNCVDELIIYKDVIIKTIIVQWWWREQSYVEAKLCILLKLSHS